MTSSTTRAFMAKKQSTSFTQVATNLLNVLQGYSKTIRLLLVMFISLSVSAEVWGEDVVYKTAKFGKEYNSQSVQSYSNSWSSTYNGFQVDITNANNNANGWAYIKMGSRTAASIGTITTNAMIDAAITKVSLKIDAITANNITSITLKTATSSNGTYTSVGTFNKETGTQTVTLASPTANLFYKIEVVCTKGSSNGLIQISQVDYYKSPEYNIIYTGDEHITYSGTKPETIKKEDYGFELAFSVNDGYQLNDVQVKMGGQNLVVEEDYLWEESYLLILPETDITGDVEIIFETLATCNTNPTVSAGSHSSVKSTTATVSCSGISSLGSAGCSITSYGFVYGTSSNPTISNTKVQVGTTYTTTNTAFTKELTGLTANTTYYVRPYATNGNGTAYGAQTSFTTLELPKYTITWNVLGAETGTTTIVEGQEWTLPEVDESCNGKQFVGWTTTKILEEQNEAPATLYTETIQFPLETNTYYAVFANVEVTGTGEYVKLTEALADYSGEYLIVYEAGNMALNGGLEDLDRADNEINVTITNNTIESNPTTEAAKFTITKVTNGYSIQSASGYYMGCTANDKGLYVSQDEQYLNQISWGIPWKDAEEGVIITSQKDPMLCYSTTAGRFRYYSSAQEPIALYKKTGTNMTNYTTSCIPTYTITWKNDDDTVLETDKVAENTMPEYNGSTPTKEADAQYTYTFNGWDPAIAPATTDATYTAIYTKTLRNYTITWKNENGTTLKTEEVEYGTTPSYTGKTPTKAETEQYTYSHNGWTPSVVAVTGDATYTATFTETLRTYTITWKNDDGTTLETDENVPYGTTPSYDGEEPTKTATAQHSYDFNGWNPTITIVTSDATYTAKYTAIVNISWVVNGQSKGSTTGVAGAHVTPPDVNPIPCGAVLAGWTDAENGVYVDGTSTLYAGEKPSIEVTENKTFYAVFADYEN